MKELGVLENGSPREWVTSDHLNLVESDGLKKQASCQAQKNTQAGAKLPARTICTNIASFS